MRLRAVVLLPLLFIAAFATAQTVGGFVAVTGCACIKNQPYSADTITIMDRTLADGNRIHRETHGKVYRDSEGRTRTETELALPAGAEPFTHVLINDPVERISIVLQRNQVATVNHYGEPHPAPVSKPVQAVPNSVAPQQSNRPQVTREDLGMQDIEGVSARGTRTTRTIPAGAEGNEQPIVVTTETWHANDLGIVVLSKSTDPRSGTTEHRLTNIQRVEQDPALFRVPADYKVKDNGTPQ